MNDLWQSNYKSMSYQQLLEALQDLRQNKLQTQFTQKETYILTELVIKNNRHEIYNIQSDLS